MRTLWGGSFFLKLSFAAIGVTATANMPLNAQSGMSPYLSVDDPIRSEIARIVKEVDYIVIEPSSNAYTPGSFVARREFDPTQNVITTTKLSFLCVPTFSTEKSAVSPIRRAISSVFGRSIELDRNFLVGQLRMHSTAEYASVVVRAIDRATVEFAEEQLTEITNKLGQICREKIQTGIAARNAYQITGIYEFRLNYEVRYRPDLRAEIRNRIQSELRRFGVSTTQSGAEVLQGEVSVYGISWKQLFR